MHILFTVYSGAYTIVVYASELVTAYSGACIIVICGSELFTVYSGAYTIVVYASELVTDIAVYILQLFVLGNYSLYIAVHIL